MNDYLIGDRVIYNKKECIILGKESSDSYWLCALGVEMDMGIFEKDVYLLEPDLYNITKPFGLCGEKVQEGLKEAFEKNKIVEFYSVYGWISTGGIPAWSRKSAYRLASPEEMMIDEKLTDIIETYRYGDREIKDVLSKIKELFKGGRMTNSQIERGIKSIKNFCNPDKEIILSDLAEVLEAMKKPEEKKNPKEPEKPEPCSHSFIVKKDYDECELCGKREYRGTKANYTIQEVYEKYREWKKENEQNPAKAKFVTELDEGEYGLVCTRDEVITIEYKNDLLRVRREKKDNVMIEDLAG